jgi:hypothetical protein
MSFASDSTHFARPASVHASTKLSPPNPRRRRDERLAVHVDRADAASK